MFDCCKCRRELVCTSLTHMAEMMLKENLKTWGIAMVCSAKALSHSGFISLRWKNDRFCNFYIIGMQIMWQLVLEVFVWNCARQYNNYTVKHVEGWRKLCAEAGHLPVVWVQIPSCHGQIPTQCERGTQASGTALKLQLQVMRNQLEGAWWLLSKDIYM